MTRSMLLLAPLLLAAAAAAQGNDDDRRQADLGRAQRELQHNRSEVDRLIDMRLRHDLGLGPLKDSGDEETFRPAGPVTTEVMEQLWKEQRDQDAATASLLERYNKLRSAVDQLRADAAERASRDAREREFVAVPTPGASAPKPRPQTNGVQTNGASSTQVPGAAPGVETAPLAPPEPPVALQRDPLRGQIHGSTDHHRVAKALFKAGQALMDRAVIAREQGQADVAKQIDTAAAERLERALEELKPLLAQKDPPFEALFYQGRCRELLFRYAERYDGLSVSANARDFQRREQEVREPFLAIAARDVEKSGARKEIEVLGLWGMAAQSAMEHFKWVNVHGGYAPRATIEGITWPGENGQ